MVLPFRSCVHSTIDIQLSLSIVIVHVIFKIWLLNFKVLLMQVLFLHSLITVTRFAMEKTKYPGLGKFAAASYPLRQPQNFFKIGSLPGIQKQSPG